MIVSGNIPAASRRSSGTLITSHAPTVSTTTCNGGLRRRSPPWLARPHSLLTTIILSLLSCQALVLAHVAQRWESGYAEQKGSRNGPDLSYNGGCEPGTVNSPELVHRPLGSHGSKRKRGRDPAQPSRSSSTKQTGRTFACPYYLHDRIRHSDCLNIRLLRLSDVRQHLLERAHYQPVHCPVCGVVFSGRLADARRIRDTHIQARTCERSPFPFNYEGITEDGEQRIREIARNNRTNQVSEAHRWFLIWDFLFPGEERPISPFLNELPEIQRLVDWSSTIFDNDTWRVLPIEPWTTTMDPEQRRAGMFDFINRFIVLARDIVVHGAGPVEDQYQADDSSYMGVNTPAPSAATANPGVGPIASAESNPAADASIRPYLSLSASPGSVTGSTEAADSGTYNHVEPSTVELPELPILPVDDSIIPFDMLNEAFEDGTRVARQHATSEPISSLSNQRVPLPSSVDSSARGSTPRPSTDTEK